MNNTITSVIVGLVLVVAVGGFVYWQNSADTDEGVYFSPTTGSTTGGEQGGNTMTQTGDSSQNTASSSGSTASAGYTIVDVSQHNSRTSCWSAINGNVYDLTSWIPNHPGGEQAILQLCGTDGSAKFNKQHGGQQRQAMVLAGFKIGALAQ